MILKDGLGSVLELHRNAGWVHVIATLKIKSLLIGYAVQFGLIYVLFKWWKRRKANAKA